MKLEHASQQRFIILTVAGFVAVAIILIALDWREVRQIIGKANWLLTLIALLLSLMSYFCLSFGYVLVNRAFSIQIGWRELFEVGFISTTINSILAFLGAAGHSLRLVLIRRHGIAAGEILAASIFHSYLNNILMLLLMIVGFFWLLIGHIVRGGGAVTLGMFTGVLVLLFIIATATIYIRPLRSWVLGLSGRIWHFFTHHDITPFIIDLDRALIHGVNALRSQRSALVFLLILMAADCAFAVAALWFCFDALGSAPNLGILLSGFGIGISAGNFSFLPGGLGVQEASMAGVYAMLGVTLAQAALASILFRVVYDFIPFFLSLGLYGRLVRTRNHESN